MAALCSPAKQLSSSRAPITEAAACKRPLRLYSLSIKCGASAAQRSTGLVQRQQGDVLQCTTAPPLPRSTAEGDWNSRVHFNRGLETVKEVDKDSLWSALEAAGDKPVVLDMYYRWCGPWRLIYPKLVKLSAIYSDVVFLKMECTAENKTVFSYLGIGILPTFKIFKNSSLVSEVKGAKYEELVSKIEKARSS